MRSRSTIRTIKGTCVCTQTDMSHYRWLHRRPYSMRFRCLTLKPVLILLSGSVDYLSPPLLQPSTSRSHQHEEIKVSIESSHIILGAAKTFYGTNGVFSAADTLSLRACSFATMTGTTAAPETTPIPSYACWMKTSLAKAKRSDKSNEQTQQCYRQVTTSTCIGRRAPMQRLVLRSAASR